MENDSECEEDYDVGQMDDEENKIHFLNHVYLFNVKREWIVKILEKVQRRLNLVREKILRDGTRYCDTGSYGDLCKKLFSPLLKLLAETAEKLKKIAWSKSDIDIDNFPIILSLMKDAELETNVHLKECKRLVRKLLDDAQQYLFFLKLFDSWEPGIL